MTADSRGARRDGRGRAGPVKFWGLFPRRRVTAKTARPAQPVVIVVGQPRPGPPPRRPRPKDPGLAVMTVTGRTGYVDDATAVRIGQDAMRRAYQFYGEHAQLKIESFGELHLTGRRAMAIVRVRCLNFDQLFDEHGQRHPPEPS